MPALLLPLPPPAGKPEPASATEAGPVFLSQEGGAGGGQGTGWRLLEGLWEKDSLPDRVLERKKGSKAAFLAQRFVPGSVGAWTVPGPPPAPGAQTKAAAEDQEVRGWEIPGPPNSSLFYSP